jgi:phospholipid transport system substrate-binding protein
MATIEINGPSVSRRGLLALIGGTFALVSVGTVPKAEAAGGPFVPIEQLDTALLAAMRAGKTIGFQQRMAILQPTLDQTLDLPAILHASVGLAWTTMSVADQDQLLAAFRRYTAANYAANFNSYDNQAFTILPDYRTLPDGRVVVQTRLGKPGGTVHEIDYVMRDTAQGWKVVDVLADGSISRVAVQRSDFSSTLASGGAPALAARMSSVVASLGASSNVA